MVYVYATKNELNKYIGKELSVEEIETTLKDLGMDLKGISNDFDPELKIELTAEKLDMVSAVGIARAIKYYKKIATQIPEYEVIIGENSLIVDESVNNSRPKTVAAIIRNIPMNKKILDDMIKIQEKIHDSFGRGRKKAAIGIYPVDEIKFPIYYNSEKSEDIIFTPLESEIEMNGREILEQHNLGKKYSHLLKDYNTYPVFRDATNKVLSMPPIINSNDTGRVDIDHQDLFIECTGYNINHLDNILKVLVTTFIEYGGQAESVLVKYPNGENYVLDLSNREESLSLNYVNKIIGINIKSDEVEQYLNKMMFSLSSIQDDIITLKIPPFKSDIFNDIDIADDIARAYGYNNIIPKFPNISSIGNILDISDFKDKISENLTRMGFLELYTYMLSSTTLHFDKMNLNIEDKEFIKLLDSADQGINMVRTMILPDNLESLRINRKNKYPQKIFENGWTIKVDEREDTGAKNEGKLSISIADPKSNYTQIKEVLDTIMSLEQIEFEVKETELPFLIKGRSANIYVKKELVGFIGELNPQVLSNFDLLVPVSSLELNLDKIFQLIKK